ncbi:CubicO group peptidase (beta-lactamase class C family) [Haloactinospora alba]|uniref:CubicO group peptidase (Beta-lactamase class C family) n=1 Tax=Haloactinospora alba TaxID=405555 RepID=A0A543NNK8_9ACTN|nr:serine hydrolase domain-containing protein [Haloactinospora alba]TQN33356.1 CubicO group peptidase (beta-lactamase class C family) [Haloactinospora alba]
MRTTVVAGALLLAAAVSGSPAAASASGTGGRFDRPQDGFAPQDTVLRAGGPTEAGLAPEPIAAAVQDTTAGTEPAAGREHPMYAGAVSLLAHDGVVVSHEATGHELRYADGSGTELPPHQREPAGPDTIFDVASVTKLFTSIAVLQLVEDGEIELDAPVAAYVPEFAAGGKRTITVEQLLTHTSGLPAEVKLWDLPPEQRIPEVLRLEPENPPGTTYTYSDPNMITLGVLVERVSGSALDEVVAERITQPLGLEDTGFTPPRHTWDRIAATEFQRDPPRGMVRGEVHDENAWSLGGVAGHAGVFSTARELAVLGQALLNGGTYDGRRILEPDTVATMLEDYNRDFPGHAHGLGFELDQRWYMGGLSAPRTAGHTGYTGTSLVLDPASRSVAVLLTNRVHPSRSWGSNNPARVALAQGLAESLAVPPRNGHHSWYAGPRGAAVLSTRELGRAEGRVEVSFDAFVDTQNDSDGTDPLSVEASTDGGGTWRPLSLSAAGDGAPDQPRESLAGAGHRAWWRVEGSFRVEDASPLRLRWRYAPDGAYVGRGVHVDTIHVSDGNGELLDAERHPGRLVGDGWVPTSR